MQKQVITDTTRFFSIDYGDRIQIGNEIYLVKGHEHEARFGIDDPKFWVKKAINMETKEKKILKLSFFESFEITIENLKILYFRNPFKETEILHLVRNHPHFMHGTSHRDEKGNNIRVLDIVNGSNFFLYIDSLKMKYENYFWEILPIILKRLIKAYEAIRFLHNYGHKHGDIRTDHLIVEQNTGDYVWIDFDYDYKASENPFSLDIFELGNILLYAVGKGFHNLNMIRSDPLTYGDLKDRVEPDDFSIIHRWKLVNLKKLYPFIPVMLNNILLHFSKGSSFFYERVEEIIEDLDRCRHAIFR